MDPEEEIEEAKARYREELEKHTKEELVEVCLKWFEKNPHVKTIYQDENGVYHVQP